MIIRLNPNVSSGWTHYPEWERRVLAFNAKYLGEMSPSQTAAMVQTLRQRLITDPVSTGYWLGFKDGVAIGHVCAWMAVDWNQPYAFVYQAEAAPGLQRAWMLELDEWVAEMNALLAARSGPLINFVEFATFNDAEAMKRLMEMAGRQNVRYRSTLRFDI